MSQIRESDVKDMLAEIADNLSELERDALKDLLRGLIERITLDLSELAYCIHYKIKLLTEELVASPRGFEPLYSP